MQFNLLTQVHHVYVYSALESLVIQAKDALHQFQAAKGASRFPGQGLQQLKFFRSEIDEFAIAPHLVRAIVDEEWAYAQFFWRLVFLLVGAPQHDTHAGDQLSRAERFGHVVISAEVEP